MTTPPSHPQVSVEETENGYIVHAGSAVATISKTILGYAVDADSQILKEEYDLSPLVTNTRKSAHDLAQLSNDTDDTRLILRASRSFLFLSHAVEMICGFLPENFPKENEWKLLSAWRSEPQVLTEPEIVDEVDAECQSFSWTVKPGISAIKRLDKSAFEHGGTGIPKAVCPFFGADKLPAGGKIPILLINNSRIFSCYILKDAHTSERVRMHWHSDFTRLLLEQQSHDTSKIHLEFVITDTKDKYEISFSRISDYKEVKKESIPQVVSSKSAKSENRNNSNIKSSSQIVKDDKPVPKKIPVKSEEKKIQPTQDNDMVAKDLPLNAGINLHDIVNGVNVPFDSDKALPHILSYDKDLFPPTIINAIHNDWSISSDKKTVIRHINPDYPLRTGTPIPTVLSNYFDVLSVPHKQSIVTTLKYNSEKYDATIHRMSEQIEESGLAARLVWGEEIQTTLEKYYNKHHIFQNIVFQKIDDVYEYELSITSKFFCDDWEFSQKNPGFSLSDLVLDLKSIIYDKGTFSICNYLLILALIRFGTENLGWENDAENIDDEYVYIPFSDIFKGWLEYLSPFVYISPDLYLDKEELTNKNLIPFRKDLQYILDYYMKLQGTVSFFSDLSNDSVPRGLNANVLNLLKTAGPIFCNEILRPFGMQHTKEHSIISVDKETEEYGALNIINEYHRGKVVNRLAIRKEWYCLFSSNIGISVIKSGILGSRIYNQLTSLNPDNKREIYNILYHLSLIRPKDVLNLSNDSKITNDSSDSSISDIEKASFSDKSYIPILRSQLILFGLEKQEATIYATLLFYSDNELMKAQLQPSRLKPEMFDSGIYLLRKRNYILLFNEKNVNNRSVTYYQKDLSPEAVYNDLVKESDKIIANMRKVSEKISVLLKLKPYSESQSLVEYLTNIGIEEREARILVRLNNSSSSVDDLAVDLGSTVNVKRIPYSIRKLYSNGWIRKTNEKQNNVLRYLLTDKLDVLVSKYVEEKAQEIASNLEEFKKFIDFRSQNPKYISEDSVNDYTEDYDTTTKNENSISPSFAEYNEKFLEAINEAVVSHSSVNNKPMDVELCPPYPRKVRVYIFNVIEAKKDDKTEIKVLLRLPGQIDKAKLNFTDTSLVILCGYYQKEELFVLWDATLHPEFANSTSLHVEKKKLWDADIYGTAIYERKLNKKGIETVMICSKDKLLETIEFRYKKHLDRLLE